MSLLLLLITASLSLSTSWKSAPWMKRMLPTGVAQLVVAGAALWSPLDVRAAGTLSEQLAAMQATQQALDAQDVEWLQVPSMPSVSFRDYRLGRGGPGVSAGSTVACEMSVRIKTLSTQKDPGGVRYWSTKLDTPDNELVWTLGQGTLLPALEVGMAGMERGSLRRIEVPSTLVFAARSKNQLPLPAPSDEEGARRFSRLFKTDATLIFEVLVKTVSPGGKVE